MVYKMNDLYRGLLLSSVETLGQVNLSNIKNVFFFKCFDQTKRIHIYIQSFIEL